MASNFIIHDQVVIQSKDNNKKEPRIKSWLLKRHNTKKHMLINYFFGAPNRNRTSDTQFRKLLLYPTEL